LNKINIKNSNNFIKNNQQNYYGKYKKNFL